MTIGTLFRRRIHAAQADAELLLSNPNLEPDERIRIERALNSLRVVRNAEQLLVVQVDTAKLLVEAEQDIIRIWIRVHQTALPSS